MVNDRRPLAPPLRNGDYHETPLVTGAHQERSDANWKLSQMVLDTPVLENAEEIEQFCIEVFPAAYDHGWYSFMLSSDAIDKLCFRWGGKIIALIVGQVAKREVWSAMLQSWPNYYDGGMNAVAAYIMLLGVAEPFRRYGLASSLLDCFMHTVKISWPMVSRTFFLHVATDNYAAMGMYSRRGFKQIRLLPRYYNYAKDTAPPDPHDAYLYLKEITPASEFLESFRRFMVSAKIGLISLFRWFTLVLVSPVQGLVEVAGKCISGRKNQRPTKVDSTKVV